MTSKTHFLDKKKEAETIIKHYMLIAAGTGFIPIPLVDGVAMSGVQYTMIRKLAFLYKVPFKEHRRKAIGAAFIGSVGTISGLKFIPKIGTMIGGISSSAIGTASTYAIGQVFMQHFDQGGTFLDFAPLASRIHFQQELEKGKAVAAKLKEEAALSTKKGQRKALQQLKADNEECLTILANMKVALEAYKNQLSEPILVVNPVAPSITEIDNKPLEETQVAVPSAEKIAAPSIAEINSEPLEKTPIVIPIEENDDSFLEQTLVTPIVAEKLSWWKRLKRWLK